MNLKKVDLPIRMAIMHHSYYFVADNILNKIWNQTAGEVRDSVFVTILNQNKV